MRFVQFSAIASKASIDPGKGIIYGVSVITAGPAEGHDLVVDQKTLKQVVALASEFKDGLKVRMNHPAKGKNADVQSISGVLKQFRIDGDHVRADLHLLQSDESFSKIIEMADKMPESFGLSINYSGSDETKDDKQVVRVTEIYACDLVDAPAANPTGLFSKKMDHDEPDGDECPHCGKADHLCSCSAMSGDDHYSEYGDVPYADTENHKYPVDTESHVRAAWSYINMPKNAKKYSPEKLARVKSKIEAAAKKHGIKISTETKKEKSSMSPVFAKALGLPETATEDEVASELSKRLSANKPADLTGLEAKIAEATKQLEAIQKDAGAAKEQAKKTEISALVSEASRDGKVVPLTDVQLAKMDVADIKEMISKLPKSQVAMQRKTATAPKNDKGEALKGDELIEFNRQRKAEGAAQLSEFMARQLKDLSIN